MACPRPARAIASFTRAHAHCKNPPPTRSRLFRDNPYIFRYNDHCNMIPFQQEQSMPFEIFISYAHKDHKLRDELAAHLGTLRNQHVISDWFDGDIIPGSEWGPDILQHLSRAE